MKAVLVAFVLIMGCSACKQIPTRPDSASSSQSGISVYGVIDAGVTMTR